MLVKLSKAAAALALLVAFAGCDDDPTLLGNLQVSYRVGSGSQTCEEAGISFVRIQVMVNDTTIAQDSTVSCDPTNQTVIFADLDVGTYLIRVQGLDGDNVVIFTGESPGAVTVEADQTNGPEMIILEQVRPSIQLWFGFAEVGGCDRFEVVDIVVMIYENGASVIFNEEYVCADRIQDGLLIEDLSENSTYDVRIRGTNSLGEYLFEYNEDGIEVHAGIPAEVSAELESCSGICSDP